MRVRKTWEEMGKRKRRVYVNSFKELYGVIKHGKEASVQAESVSCNGEDRTRDIHEVALEGVPKSL